LHTNNPRKIKGLQDAGVLVSSRTPLLVPARAENKLYLATKRSRSGHLIEFEGPEDDEG
jgi:GTP cyclohydrolase II